MAVQANVPLAGHVEPLAVEQVKVLADFGEPELVLNLLEELELPVLGLLGLFPFVQLGSLPIQALQPSVQ